MNIGMEIQGKLPWNWYGLAWTQTDNDAWHVSDVIQHKELYFRDIVAMYHAAVPSKREAGIFFYLYWPCAYGFFAKVKVSFSPDSSNHIYMTLGKLHMGYGSSQKVLLYIFFHWVNQHIFLCPYIDNYHIFTSLSRKEGALLYVICGWSETKGANVVSMLSKWQYLCTIWWICWQYFVITLVVVVSFLLSLEKSKYPLARNPSLNSESSFSNRVSFKEFRLVRIYCPKGIEAKSGFGWKLEASKMVFAAVSFLNNPLWIELSVCFLIVRSKNIMVDLSWVMVMNLRWNVLSELMYSKNWLRSGIGPSRSNMTSSV